jgi:hypothetical protein
LLCTTQFRDAHAVTTLALRFGSFQLQQGSGAICLSHLSHLIPAAERAMLKQCHCCNPSFRPRLDVDIRATSVNRHETGILLTAALFWCRLQQHYLLAKEVSVQHARGMYGLRLICCRWLRSVHRPVAATFTFCRVLEYVVVVVVVGIVFCGYRTLKMFQGYPDYQHDIIFLFLFEEALPTQYSN